MDKTYSSSTCSSLFGRHHKPPNGSPMRGLLDIAKKAWETQPFPYRSAVNYMHEMQQKMDKISPIIREHLHTKEEEQK